MNPCARVTLYLASASLLGTLMALALSDIPPFGAYRGPYGDLVMQTVVKARGTAQGVAAVTFDYRGFDTLGEEFILFAAVAGGLLLMRAQREEQRHRPVDQALSRRIPPVSEAVHAMGLIMFPLTLVIGLYVIIHGHLSPGGGFQGGVLTATAFLFVYLSGEYEELTLLMPDHLVDFLEASGAAAFAVIGAIPILLHEPFMHNFLPTGKQGDIASAGDIPLCNASVGLEVAAGFLLLIASFIRQVLVIRKGK